MLNPKCYRCWPLASLLVFLHGNLQADLAVIVSAKRSPVKMTQEDVSKIFLAKTTTFADGSRALPVDQTSGTPLRDLFNAKVLDKSDGQLKAYWSRVVFTGTGTPPKEVGGDNEVKKLVADNPNLIGYIDKTKLDSSVVAILSIE